MTTIELHFWILPVRPQFARLLLRNPPYACQLLISKTCKKPEFRTGTNKSKRHNDAPRLLLPIGPAFSSDLFLILARFPRKRLFSVQRFKPLISLEFFCLHNTDSIHLIYLSKLLAFAVSRNSCRLYCAMKTSLVIIKLVFLFLGEAHSESFPDMTIMHHVTIPCRTLLNTNSSSKSLNCSWAAWRFFSSDSVTVLLSCSNMSHATLITRSNRNIHNHIWFWRRFFTAKTSLFIIHFTKRSSADCLYILY